MIHRRYRRMAVLDAYGDLEPAGQERLRRHLSRCPECRSWGRETAAALRSIPRTAQATFTPDLKARIIGSVRQEGGTPSRQPIRTGVRPWGIPRAVLVPASALLLVGIGYVIGRLTLEPSPSAPPLPASAARAERVSSYLDRSHALLIGILNAPAPGGQTGFASLSAEREASRALVRDAGTLREELDRPENARAKKLIEELELILLQIANLDGNQAPVGVRVVREGVEDRSIILRIIIERMELRERESAAPSRADGQNS